MTADTTLQVIQCGGGRVGSGARARLGSWVCCGARAAGVSWAGCDVVQGNLIASGAGAGLAAIYNVPFGGTLFAIEVMVGFQTLPKGWKLGRCNASSFQLLWWRGWRRSWRA